MRVKPGNESINTNVRQKREEPWGLAESSFQTHLLFKERNADKLKAAGTVESLTKTSGNKGASSSSRLHIELSQTSVLICHLNGEINVVVMEVPLSITHLLK